MPDLGLRADVGDLNVFGASPCCVSPYIRLWFFPTNKSFEELGLIVAC